MNVASQQIADNLPEIYRDILVTFPELEPSRKAGYGLAFQTIFARLEKKWSMGQIIAACKQMDEKGAVTIKNSIFVHPTQAGEELITALTGKQPAPIEVPPFPSLR